MENRKKPTRRDFLKLAGAVSGSSILAACAPAQPAAPAANPTVAMPAVQGIKVLRFISDETAPATVEFYRKAIDEYRKEHSDIDIDLVIINEDMKVLRATSAFQTGGDMGIFVTPIAPVPEWIEQGHMLPITDVIKEIGEDQFLPGSRLIINGADYAMPYQMNVYAMWYRKDLLDKAGLAVPQNYEELLAASQALTKDGMFGIGIPSSDGADVMQTFLTPTYHQSGLDYFDKKGNLTFDKPESLEATKRYLELMKYAPDGLKAAGSFGDMINAYVAGQVAFGVYAGRMGIAIESRAPELADKTGVTGFSMGPKSSALCNNVFTGYPSWYFIHSKTQYPEEAKQFLKYLMTGWRGVEFAKTVPGHVLPQIKSVRDEYLAADYDYGKKHSDWIRTLLQLVENASNPAVFMGSVVDNKFDRTINLMPWAGPLFHAGNPLGKMTGSVLLENKPVEEAWQQAVMEVKQIAETWKAEHPNWKPLGS